MADTTAKIVKAAERLRKAQGETDAARIELLRLMRHEIAAGRATKSGIARALGVSRQRVQQMLDD